MWDSNLKTNLKNLYCIQYKLGSDNLLIDFLLSARNSKSEMGYLSKERGYMRLSHSASKCLSVQ